MRLSCGRVLAALILTLAFAGIGFPAARAAPGDICTVRFHIKTGTGQNWGIRDDSFEHITLGGQPFLFDDWDGVAGPNVRPRPYHRGGTGDRAGVWLDPWVGHLAVCATPADLADGFTIQHVSLADDIEADNWRLAEIRIVQIFDDMTETQLVHLAPPGGGNLHEFLKNADQTFTVPVDVGSPADPPADPSRSICKVEFRIKTGSRDFWGIRDDSFEHISLGGQPFLFDDWNGAGGDGVLPRPYHRGGTDDAGGVWLGPWVGHLAVCARPADLRGGFTFEHVSMADDLGADNWDLAAIKISQVLDDGTRVQLVNQAAPAGEHLHEFLKNAGQVFHTLDLDSDRDGLSDRMELHGIPGSARVDTWLPDNGADPCRPTIAVELDWLHISDDVNDKPDPAAIAEAVAMFDTAPTGRLAVCPYRRETENGVQLLVDVDDKIPVTAQRRAEPLNLERSDGQTPFRRFRAEHFTPGRTGLFRYNLWGYRHNNTDESGWCCDGMDFAVTLGTMPDAPVRVQSGTFVHELGHALGLKHGGTDEVNYKPNYLSAMNFRYTATGIPDIQAWDQQPATDGGTRLLQDLDRVSRLDWSGRELPPLHRGDLDERTGIGVTSHAMAAWWDNGGTLRVGDGSAALNWDADEVPGEPSVHVDVNGEFQKCVEGTQTELLPQVPGSDYDDLRRYERIFAGRNARCQTPPRMGDRAALVPGDEDGARVGPGYDYGQAFGYAQGLAGADDWSAIQLQFGKGEGSGPVLADEATELTTGEITRDRRRVVDALVAATAPGPGGQPRWGYAYMDRATPSEAPIGAVTPLNAQWQWSTGRLDPATADRRATVVHTGTGTYEVRLPGIASAAGIAHVTPYRTVYRGRTCGVTGYAPDGPDELIKVRCFNETGAPVDWWFTVFFAAPGPGQTPYATLRYDGAAGTATVDPARNDGTFNSAGGVNRVVRESTGRYRVTVEGEAFAERAGYAQVTPYGGGAPARCNPSGVTPGTGQVEIIVACHVIGTGAPADSSWLLSYTDGAGLHRDAGTPAAYVSVTGDPAAPLVDAARSFSGNGETPSLTRLGVGYYRLTWNTLGKTGDSVQVAATGPGDGYCHLGTIDSYSAPPRLSVYVYCHTAAGVPGDNTFGLAYVRAP
ncbi:hypothetical protein ABZW49_38915 [Nonomuraea wenchangensis]